MATRKLGRIETQVVRDAREAALPDTDRAGILAAQTLARALDDNAGDWEVTKDIAPKLVTALTALGLTHAGRVVRTKGYAGGVTKNDDKPSGATVLKLLQSQYKAQ